MHFKKVIKKLNELNATINFSKSIFFTDNVDYLGINISAKGFNPIISNNLDLDKLKMPTKIKELQKLLGIINWYRPFVHNLFIKLKPVTSILLKKKKIIWNNEKTEIFNL